MEIRNISLIGFMGTGKTSVGKVLAKRLSRPVVDVDLFIEQGEKRKISEIFRDAGEPYFRALEKKAIQEICKRRGIIITTGGGAVIDAENIASLKESGWVVCLAASPKTIYQRIKDSRHRPLLGGQDKLGGIQQLLELRRPFYEKADFRCETDGRSSAQVAALILEMLAGKL